MEEFEINNRIIELIKELKISQNQFANEVGTTSSRISNIVRYRNKPDSELLQKVLLKYRNVSSDWLILGDGAIFRGEGKRPEIIKCRSCIEKDGQIKLLKEQLKECQERKG